MKRKSRVSRKEKRKEEVRKIERNKTLEVIERVRVVVAAGMVESVGKIYRVIRGVVEVVRV